jgi:tetratricopeptide (TPR) repeat protein
MFFFLRPFLSPSVEDQAEKALQSGNPQGVLQVLAATESSAEASFLKARALMELHREKDALEHYETAFELAPNILEKAEVLADLSSLLGSAYTDKAQSLLIRAGDKSVDVLAQAASDTNSRLRRWSAIKALQTLNRSDRVDLGAAYIADLKSKDCSVLRNASRELGELGDKRAVLYLKEISQRTRFGIFDACETSAAREALNKISRK